ncbi:AAA family ATPase [Fodinisporobacter ferrooxydans]|uniref:AAA family ATPase n=1 Tax=Fodinisporobacter ferrooxydans TaxID=2901836 RepID=A0ABY4CN76_9BACL|nr:AAA family ATPase [Alicyclobacillaceae bacterium MYW30-H2]
MLKSFSVCRYRNLNIDELQLKRINVLIGPNNSGKSNLIDALSFLSSLILSKEIDGTSSIFLRELLKRGWDDVLDRRETKPNEVKMSWVIEGVNELPELKYELNFHVPVTSKPPEGYNISLEKLSNTKPIESKDRPYEYFQCHNEQLGLGWFSGKARGNKQTKRVRIQVNCQETIFNQMDTLLDHEEFRISTYPVFKSALETVRKFFQGFYAYSSTEINLKKVRQPVGVQLSLKYLSKDADNYVNVLRFIEEKHEGFLVQYTKIIQEIIPNLSQMRIINMEDNKSFLQLQISKQWYHLSEMSDGTIKGMIIALLLWSPERMTLLSLDEPELNLHPAWLRVISNWIIRSNMPKQIFVSTHSPDLLDGLTDLFMEDKLNLYAFNLDEDQTLKLVSPETVRSLYEQGWQLGDMYRVGQPELGAWPW